RRVVLSYRAAAIFANLAVLEDFLEQRRQPDAGSGEPIRGARYVFDLILESDGIARSECAIGSGYLVGTPSDEQALVGPSFCAPVALEPIIRLGAFRQRLEVAHQDVFISKSPAEQSRIPHLVQVRVLIAPESELHGVATTVIPIGHVHRLVHI